MKFKKESMVCVFTAMLMMTMMLSMIDVGNSMPARATPTLSYGGYGYGTMYEDSFFNFTVYYIDTDGDAPFYANVTIDQIGHAMSNSYGSTNYTRGVNYHYNTTLTAGTHSYSFWFYNNKGEEVLDPAAGSYSLTVLSRNESLPTLTNPSFLPVRPVKGTPVNFSVTYTDLDNDPATAVKIIIDYSNNTMLDGSFGDGSYPQIGVPYYYNVTLNEGNHSYCFWAINSANETVRLPTTGMYNLYVAPDSGSGNLPILYSQWVLPRSPTADDNITFSIYYKDIDNDAPDYVRIHIWQTNQSIDPYYTYNMTGTGSSYSSGVQFRYTTRLTLGVYNYYFTTESNEEVIYNGNYSLSVESSSNRATLSNPQFSPSNPSSTDTINFTVTYQDLDGDAPEYLKLILGPTSDLERNTPMPEYAMTIVGMSYSSGVVAYETFQLAPGNYSYRFVTASNGEADGIPRGQVNSSIGYFYSMYVSNGSSSTNRAPQLLNPSISPARPFSGQLVTFSVTYKDADNDPPRQFLLNITPASGGAPFSVRMNTPYSYAFSMGLVFSGSIKLSQGNYTYYFTVTSLKVTVNLPATGSFSLYVSAPPSSGVAPTLYSPGVSPSRPTNNQVVNFTIYYKDLDDDAPSYVRLYLSSGNSSRSFTNYSMRVSGSVYSQGVICFHAKSLASGTYYYYFQASSGNDTVTYPSTGYSTLTVGTSGGSNRNDVRCAIAVVDGEADLRIEDEGTTITLSLLDLDEDSIWIKVGSDTGESKVIILDIDPSVLDLSDPDALRILIDGEKVSLADLDWMSDPSGSEPRYHLVIDDEGAHLHLYMPDISSHIVEASIVKDDVEPSNGWMFILMAVVVTLALAATAGALLARAQVEKRKKVEEYYEDFDISSGDSRVTGGPLEEGESSVDWDELL